jgi:hypothetical protein
MLLHSSLWDAFPHYEIMMLNFVIWCMWIVGFLWIWMLDLISVNLVISWLVIGCNPWWLPNPDWLQDAAGKQAAGYWSIKAHYKHWSLSNGIQLEHSLQTCQQSNGHCKSPLPVLTGGPHNVARSSSHQRRRFTTRVSDIDFTVTGFVLVPVTKIPYGSRETVIFTWPVTSCGNGCCLIPVTNHSCAETRVK